MQALDNNEIVALGATVGGHGLLLAVIALGLLGMEEHIAKPEALSVTLTGAGSPLPVTGDFGSAPPAAAPESAEEEPAPMAESQAEAKLEAASEKADAAAEVAAAARAEAQKLAAAAAAADATAAEKKKAREAAEKAARLKREKEAADKKAREARERAAKEKAAREKAAKEKAAREKAERDKAAKDFEGVGKGLGGNASATPGEARSKASASIGAEVRPFIPSCAPRTGDGSSLRVFARLTIGRDKSLQSVNIYDVKGVTPSNSAQVEPMKRCVQQALRNASPYNLNADDYDVWKNHAVQLKVNFK